MSVRLEQVQDAVVRQSSTGIEVVRRAIIDGVTGPAALRQRAALETPGLPRYGDRHPAWGELRVVSIEMTPLDPSQWEASITYRVPDPGDLAHMDAPGTVVDISWFSVTVTESLTNDIRGDRLYHWYIGRPLTPVLTGVGVRWSRLFTKFLWKNENVEAQRPSVGARVTVSDNTSIRGRLGLAATVNSGWWSGFPPKTWLIGGMDSREERGRWLNIYELLYNPGTWQYRSAIEYFGAPPDDATLGNGIELFDVYRESNYSLLGFSI